MTDADDQGTAVVLPLGQDPDAGPWELLARGEGAVLTAAPSPGTGVPWGPALRATSTLGKQLAAAAEQVTQVAGASGKRYLLQLPKGYGEQHLVRAVGGLHGMVRGAGGRFAGQATLVPLSPATLLKGTNPVALGLLALTIAGEMAGGDEQARTLAEIQRGVDRLNARFDLEDDARLKTAEQTIRSAHAALLDGATIPESVGLGAAMTHLQVLRNRSEALREGWERVVDALPAGGTSGPELRDALGDVGKIGWDGFAKAVQTAYHAVALDSRRIMLTAAEAQLRNPGSPLSSFRDAVESDLEARAQEIERLRSLFSRLAATPLTVTTWSGGLLPHRVTDTAVENAHTQALFASLAAALRPLAPPAEVTDAITVDSLPDGSLQLVRAS